MCDRVGANASTPWFHDAHHDRDHDHDHDHDAAHHSSSPTPTPPSVSLSVSDHKGSIPSPELAPDQAPPRYSLELSSTPRHGTHILPGQQQLPPLEPRPSQGSLSPVILPSFNSLESFIRRCPSPPSHDPTRHPQNAPLSSGPHPHLKLWKSESWKSENINNMVIDQPSASVSSALAGQQLNVPAPSLPTGYPGMRLLLGDTQRKSRVETQIKQLITLEFNGERVTQYHYIHVPQSASVKRYKVPPKNVPANAILTLEALAIPSSYPAVQASCCRTCYSREAKRKPEAYPDTLPQNLSPIDFACSEYLEFNSGTAIIPFRIICYSRHHSEKEGFNVRLILRDQQGVVAAVQTPPIMITDDRKAVKRSIAAAEANGVPHGLPMDRKRNLDCVEDSDDVIMPRATRPRTASYVPTTRDCTGAGPSSNPYKPGKSQPTLYTQPNSLHPSLAHTVAQLASLDGVFPNKGSTKGGIQVAVTGVHLTPNSTVSFGGTPVVDLVYKCDRLIICVLPRAPSPGSVPVSLGGAPTDPNVPFPSFTYENDGNKDSGMISTALAVMAYRETGKWENAIDVANRVLASNSSEKKIFRDKKPVYNQNISRARFSPNGH